MTEPAPMSAPIAAPDVAHDDGPSPRPVGQSGAGTGRRSCSLTTLQLNRLDAACYPLSLAFPDDLCQTYLVGSAHRGEDFRDVDVRLMLSDPVWADTFASRQRLWEAFCLAWSAYLSTAIGLPVDFQVQQMSAANEKHSGSRNPLGHDHRPFAGLGDATVWTYPEEARRG